MGYLTPSGDTADCRLPGKSPGQNTGVGCLFPSPGDLSDSGIEPMSPVSSALAGGFFTTVLPGTDSMGWGMVLKCGIKHIILLTFNFRDLKRFCTTCYADWHYFNFFFFFGCSGSLFWYMHFSLVAAWRLCCPHEILVTWDLRYVRS